MELNSVLFPAGYVVKMTKILTSILYYALFKTIYISIDLGANDVKSISVNRPFNIYITYSTVNSIFVEIQPDSTNIKMTLVGTPYGQPTNFF